MPRIELVIDSDNKPANLLDSKAIVQGCRDAANADSNSNYIRGTRLVDKSRGAAYAWDLVGKAINGKADAPVRAPCVYQVYLAFRFGAYGFIVMEYINGSICDDSDAKLVTAAVQSLIAVWGPTPKPGPVGGGPIGDRFFVDSWMSSMTYHSVEELEKTCSDHGVNFGPEVDDHDLRLCLNRPNFMRDSWGRIVALNFGEICFLPVSFFNLALYEGDNFTQLIARRLKYPASTQLNAMLTASYAMVPYGTDKIGIPSELKHKVK